MQAGRELCVCVCCVGGVFVCVACVCVCVVWGGVLCMCVCVVWVGVVWGGVVHLDAHCSLPFRCGSCRTVWTFHPVPSTPPPPAGGFATGFDVQCGQCGTGQTHLKGSAGTFGYQVLCVNHWYQKWWSGQLIQLVPWDFTGKLAPCCWCEG